MDATSDPTPAAQRWETKVPRSEAEGTYNVRKFRCRTVAHGTAHRTYIRELPPLGGEVADTSPLTDEGTATPCESSSRCSWFVSLDWNSRERGGACYSDSSL